MAGKSGKGIGKVSAKRHARKPNKASIEGITDHQIKLLIYHHNFTQNQNLLLYKASNQKISKKRRCQKNFIIPL